MGELLECDDEVHVFLGKRKRCQCGTAHVDEPPKDWSSFDGFETRPVQSQQETKE